jgi:YVTN family beta-propeller protein
MGSNSVTVIDWYNSVIATIRVDSKPCALVYNSASNKIYCANQQCNDVSIINGTTNEVVNTISVGNRPSALVCDSIHNKVYCANANSNSVSVIDGVNDNVITTINVGLYPMTLIYNRTNNKIYCGNMDSENITIIDGATNQAIGTIPVGRTPVSMCYNSTNNKVYCASWSNGRIHIINGATDQIIDSIIYGNSGPQALIYDYYFNRIFYVNFTGDNIKVIDGNSDSIIATKQLPVGTRPYALACAYINIYCANIGVNTVAVFDAYYLNTIATINTSYPIALFSVHDYRIYVANLWSSSTTVIRQNLPGIEEIRNIGQKGQEFEVYPNPAKSFFTISGPISASRQTLKMFDISGKLIRVKEFEKELRVDLKGINPGVYFLQLGNDISAKKLVITK